MFRFSSRITPKKENKVTDLASRPPVSVSNRKYRRGLMLNFSFCACRRKAYHEEGEG
jgi:hypothetical protein